MIHQDDEYARSRGSEPPRNFWRTLRGRGGPPTRRGAAASRRGVTANHARARGGARTPTPTTNTTERGGGRTASSSASWAAGTTASEPRRRVPDDDPDWQPEFSELFGEDPDPPRPRRGGARHRASQHQDGSEVGTSPPVPLVSVPATQRLSLVSQSQDNGDEEMVDVGDTGEDFVSGHLALVDLALLCSPFTFPPTCS